MSNSDVMQENFIRVYDNIVSREFCQGVIEYFEWCVENNRVWERLESTSLNKKDLSTTINPQTQVDISFSRSHLGGYLQEFNSAFWDVAYKEYTKEFDILNTFEKHSILSYKVQKTLPGGGYHVWHAENGSMHLAGRIGVYILYLNDVSSGGETEFLYLSERVQPKESRLLIFPAGYTHTHRGNPPLRGAKYIMTGWIELV